MKEDHVDALICDYCKKSIEIGDKYFSVEHGIAFCKRKEDDAFGDAYDLQLWDEDFCSPLCLGRRLADRVKYDYKTGKPKRAKK